MAERPTTARRSLMPNSPGTEEAAEELSARRETNAQLEDRHKRALADLDNYRKRSMRELDQRVAESRAALVRDWLEAVDAVDRAIAMDPENPTAEGLRVGLAQMEGILDRQGGRRGGRGGGAFDPMRGGGGG